MSTADLNDVLDNLWLYIRLNDGGFIVEDRRLRGMLGDADYKTLCQCVEKNIIRGTIWYAGAVRDFRKAKGERMPEKELMLRLRRDGEIVGYEWHMEGNILHNQALVPFGDEQHHWRRAETYAFITHDSFDMGIKVGGEWWFEGDRIGSRSGLGALVYEPGECGIPDWGVRMDDGSNQCLWYMIGEGQSPHLLDGQAHEGMPE